MGGILKNESHHARLRLHNSSTYETYKMSKIVISRSEISVQIILRCDSTRQEYLPIYQEHDKNYDVTKKTNTIAKKEDVGILKDYQERRR